MNTPITGTTSQQEIIRQNLAAVGEVQRRATEARTLQDRSADRITAFSGSMAFVYLHTVWFGLWILLNVGPLHVPHLTGFDPYPFGLLTLIVSLEAIYLSTFVLISQNRLAVSSEQRAQLDLHVDLLAEQKVAKILERLDHITEQLNTMDNAFHVPHDPEVHALQASPTAGEVLQVIEDAAREATQEVKPTSGKDRQEMAGEIGAVREGVDRVSEQVEGVATDLHEIKEQSK